MIYSSRFLGIDYGDKKIGLAISDENKVLAFPKEVILNDNYTLSKISEILKAEKVSEIVVGESLDLKGKPNTISNDIDIFISKLEIKFNVPIHRQKEFFTSIEARRYKDIKKADASAAALILQRYLDRMNLSRHSGTSNDFHRRFQKN